MQAFYDCCCIYEISTTQDTHQMGIELRNLDPCCTMHRHGMETTLQVHQNKMIQLIKMRFATTNNASENNHVDLILLLWDVA